MAIGVVSIVSTKNVIETILPNGQNFIVVFPRGDEGKVICRRINKGCVITQKQTLFRNYVEFPFVDPMYGDCPVDVYVQVGNGTNVLTKITYIWG